MQVEKVPKSKAALRVRRQLVEAILFEKLLPYKEEKVTRALSHFFIKGRSATFRCTGKISAFGRIRIEEELVYKLTSSGEIHQAVIAEFIAELNPEAEIGRLLLQELEQTIYLTDWNEEHIPQLLSRRQVNGLELDSAIIEGHPYHPCFKSRTGFTVEDHKRYGPEAGQEFSLVWLAVKRKDLKFNYPKEEQSFWQKELGTNQWRDLVLALCQKGGQLDEYTFLPVHPWQWDAIKEQYADSLESRDIIVLGEYGDLYRATQSVRTLMNRSNPHKAMIKLSMNLVHTSSVRTLMPHSVCTAPALSDWLHKVLLSDNYLLDKGVVMLKEYAGALFEPKGWRSNESAGQLAAIWRENITNYLKSNEEFIPFNAILLKEKDGHLFISEWIKKYGVEKWVTQLIKTAVIPVWHLLVNHGIALETHSQNMLLIHEEGWPLRVALRDFHESVEYVDSFLKSKEGLPDFTQLDEVYNGAKDNQYYWMQEVEALRELVMDTLFVYNLSELSFLLDREDFISEEQFWELVDKELTDYISCFPENRERAAHIDYRRENIMAESLLKKKLNRESQIEHRHLVPNSLAINQDTRRAEHVLC
ncbi:IucA/IucC family protein [Alkalihalophilus marmarensis]|uniref:IucA/IucC family protein n=1 Tax=Alkalihalophilus marmarensis TaxID=521377 RepID=UPI002DBDDE4C|nr:IucA/IucC family protein [Alkalihalophilus marmarensis]MEC2071938.1 IucA/IucC family protein [Alkalihalophilus marmarensis]